MRRNSFLKVIACLMIAAMLMGLNFIPAFGASETDFTFDASTGTITGYHGAGGDVEIPSIINGVTVKSIGEQAFYCCSLTGITIPDSVTSIGDDAFCACGFTSITIPASVTSIGDDAFNNCSSLTNITILNGVTSIGSSAFAGCRSLTSITIPASVTSIGVCAFVFCSNLAVITVDASNAAYASADGVLFNKAMTELIVYPDGKSGSYTIPSSVTNIGDYAFSQCSSLTSIRIPASVTSVGNCAFTGCSGLTSITIPNSVTIIGESEFEQCENLASITVDASNIAYASADGVLFNKAMTELIECPSSKSGSYTIPSSVTSI